MGGVNEVAELLGVSRQRVAKLRVRADFPEPIGNVSGRAVWDLGAVSAWNASGSRQAPGRPTGESRARLLGGRFLLEEKIDGGGYADVFRAIDRKQTDSVPQPVAVKILRELDDKTLRRMERELRLLSGIEHQNVMTILGSGDTEDGEYFYVMPLARGSLVQYAEEFEGLDNRSRLLDLMKQICAGLEHIHQQGVLHRDLKPGNILRFEPDRWVLADFGLAVEVARETTTLTATFDGFGTPWYTAPEQWAGGARDVTEQADIFSLGRILQELYTGGRGVSVPAGDLRRVILRATAERPEERHRDVNEFLTDLERAVTSQSNARWEPLEETAERHLQRLRFDNTSAEDLDEFLDWALTLDPEDSEEGEALTDTLPALDYSSIVTLWTSRPMDLRDVFRAHSARVGSSQTFDFGYCDILADFARRMIAATRDSEILQYAIASLVQLGHNHNRWHVKDVVTGLLQSLRGQNAIQAAIDGLHDTDTEALAWTINDFSLRSLAPALRSAIRNLL
ncbi:serine/threonine protein kinase [Amycolatopsis sp. Hca4]|nr:serine/threonine protein kinase [Amycolatopsis sp. Hca4]